MASIADSGAMSSKLHSSFDFAEQIRKLDIEANSLLGASILPPATATAGGSPKRSYGNVGSFNMFTSASTGSTAPAKSSSLLDLSSSHNTLEDLKSQMEAQTQETARLQRALLGESALNTGLSRSTAEIPTYTSLPSTFSTTLDVTSSLSTARKPLAEVPESHLHRALKMSQEEIASLKQKVQEVKNEAEQQKLRFRSSLEEVKAKLQETVVGRDSLLEIKDQEVRKYEQTVHELKAAITEMEENNQLKDQKLLELMQKFEKIQQEQHMLNTSMAQIRSLVHDREMRRGRPYYDGEPLSKQGPAMLVHTLERCVKEFDEELEIRKQKIRQLERDLEDGKKTAAEKQRNLLAEQQEREQNALQIRVKEDYIRDLESRLTQLKEEGESERKFWSDKKKALECGLDEAQRELTTVRSERDEAIRNASAIESRFEDYQLNIRRLEQELEEEREQKKSLIEKEVEGRKKIDWVTTKLEQKEVDVKRLEAMVDTVKQECNNQLHNKVSYIEKFEKERVSEQMNSLQTQLNSTSDKCTKVTMELELAKSELTQLRTRNAELQEELNNSKVKLEIVTGEKSHQGSLLQDSISEAERLKQERDYYLNLMEMQNTELSDLRQTKERLAVQLEEKENNYSALKQQTENMSHMVEFNTQTSTNMKEERQRLMGLIEEKTIENEDLRHTRDSAMKKLKIREKRLKEIEEQNARYAHDMKTRLKEVEKLTKEKNELFLELKDSRYDVANVKQERNKLKSELKSREKNTEKEIERLVARAKGAEQELKLARKALKTHESVDGKAVKVAGKMQKEVTAKRGQIDALQSKVHWLEESLENALKSKNQLTEENERLSSSLKRSSGQDEKLLKELESYVHKQKMMKEQISQLETALEKAGIKHAAAQAQVEQYEQDLARLKLKHQLEIKEIQRNGSTAPKLSSLTLSHLAKSTPETVPSVHFSTVQSSIQPGHSATSGQSALPSYSATSGHSALTSQPAISGYSDVRGTQQGRSAAYASEVEIPVSLKPAQPQQNQAGVNAVGSELKSLLNEMRSLIYSAHGQQSASNQQQPHLVPNQLTTSEKQVARGDMPYSSLDYPGGLAHKSKREHSRKKHKQYRSHKPFGVKSLTSDSLSSSSERDVLSDTDIDRTAADKDLHIDTTSIISGSKATMSSATDDMILHYRPSRYKPKPAAPPPSAYHNILRDDVHDLITSNKMRTFNSNPVNDAESVVSSSLASRVSLDDLKKKGDAMKTMLNTETQEVCRRLEKKIENLSRMGGYLQKENQEMADLISDQGKKLKKVKESEKSVTQLLKK